MANDETPEIGSITWFDLTVENATEVRDFYASVTGWEFEEISMGEYSDYSMLLPGSRKGISGICHARGGNTGIPAQWLMYITVEDIERSRESCEKRSGKLLSPVKEYPGVGKYCIVQDPSGAAVALFEYLKK